MSARLYWVFLPVVWSSVALAQTGAQAPRTAPAATVTSRQGEAIVAAAWTREQQGGPNPDCSHLVHEVYSIAGLRYPYTDSFDLYVGAANFVRVTRPQAGDLIVWRGHVGIVVNPAQHSFYSSLRSGLGTDFYDAPYWKARGPARFYRFVRPAGARVIVAQQRLEAPSEPVKASSGDEDSVESASRFAEAEDGRLDGATGVVEAHDSPAAEEPFEIPSSILVVTAKRFPTHDEVAEAVSEMNNAAASILGQGNPAQRTRRVVIYDKLAVERVDAKGQHGTAKIRIDSRAELMGQHIRSGPGPEEVRLKLVRTTQGWEVQGQPDCVYVPRDVAIHQLATRLALLTQDASGSETNSKLSDQSRIIRVLSTLAEGM